MGKKVLIVLADGFEEIEAITSIDVLRRAGLEVTVAGLNAKDVAGAHGVKVACDALLERYQGLPDAIVLPGGMPGSKNLAQSKKIKELVVQMNREKKLVGAICAAPALVVAPTGVLDGRRATCYPGFENNFTSRMTFSEDRVVTDGNVTTSRGPGSALEFALELAKQLAGEVTARQLREGLLAKS